MKREERADEIQRVSRDRKYGGRIREAIELLEVLVSVVEVRYGVFEVRVRRTRCYARA